MASTVAERIELAKLCRSKDWSKAIRLLDSLIAQSCVYQDLCNRAFCYSQLELHKHVIKDCDKALQLDPTLLQAYILKGRAFFAMGRKEEALLVWEEGYEYTVSQSTDLKQLLELGELLAVAKQDIALASRNHAVDSSGSSNAASESLRLVPMKSNNTSNNKKRSNDEFQVSNKSSEHVVTDDGSDHRPDRSSKSDCEVKEIKKSDSNGNGSYARLPMVTHNGLDYRPDRSSKTIYEVKNIKKSDSNGNGTYARQPNGTIDISNGVHNQSAICGELKDKSETRNKSSVISCESSNISEVLSQSSNDSHNDSSDEARTDKKLYVTRISRTKSISVDFRLSRGIAQVNEGNYTHAISIFDQILQEEPTYPEALIGRGTAYAFQRELDSAIGDFTKAIQTNPAAGEAWKRRGQARAALGEFSEAIADLSEALKFEPNLADVLHERGIVNFKYKDFKAAVEDLSACVKLDKYNKSAYTYLGLAYSSLGEYKRAEEAHKKAIQLDHNFVEAWAHLAQFYLDWGNIAKALESLQQLLEIDGRFAKAYHLLGLLLQGMGEHKNAIKELSTGLSIDSSNIDCLYLRASCYHAIGEYKEAVKDYDAALDLELDSMEKFVLQCLAFYQKEIALYTASKLSSEFCWFDIDGDIDPFFKEYWCKKLHPKNVCEKVYRQPPLRDSLRKGKHKKQDFSSNKQKNALLQAADSIGKNIQYHCPGYLRSKRQHRVGGLAAIEIAQKISKFWRSLQAEWKHPNKGASKYAKKIRRKERTNPTSQNRGGAGCSTSSSSDASTLSNSPEGLSGRFTTSWHDVYSLAVRWRQISEPCDPVVWVNKLSEEYNSGFGSHTPLVLGQAKVVRYFPNFQRTLNVAKTVIKENKYVRDKKDDIIYLSDEGKLQEIMNAESCSDLYKAIGDDFWLATRCSSTAFDGKNLEGTRITLAKTGDTGFEFGIRSSCMPSRWDEFNVEMTSAWEALCDAYNGEAYGSTDFDALEKVREAILRMTYYWYNLMPLSRGSAAVGFIVLLGLLLAANMEFTGSIPEGLQVDWEAILSFDPNSFVDSVKSWLYPYLKMTTSWKGYPDVASTFETTGSVVAALSSYSD